VASLAARVDAQTEPPRRVAHLWVDGRNGDDAQATSNNPRLVTLCPSPSTNGCTTSIPCPASTTFKPNDELFQEKPLLHAPWPYKTITAAITYITSLPGGGLPYTSPVTGVVWEYAIIHLLPGRYSSRTQVDPHNGLTGNAETFPIRLPNRVSIKGTSTLNTYFELYQDATRRTNGPVFEFGATAATTGEHCFIDSVSILGAPFTPDPLNPEHRKQSAIHMDPAFRSKVTISNCWIYANGVGILVDAPEVLPGTWHEVILVNNTFVWNDCAIWNGQTVRGNQSIGWSKLALVNNIIDASKPDQGVLATFRPRPTTMSYQLPLPNRSNVSAFEGVAADDVIVATAPAGDFNAYETFQFDLQVPIAMLGLPITTARSTQPGGAGINIRPYTGATNIGVPFYRGVIYIRDLIYNEQLKNAPPNAPRIFYRTPGCDASPGDFRLAPAMAPQSGTSAGAIIDPGAKDPPTGLLSILVDTGREGPFTMLNGLGLAVGPGYLPLGESQATWPWHNWITDCEGFGNPRIVDHPVYTNGAGGRIDVGADELGAQINIGMRWGTTMFMHDYLTPNTMDNDYMWFMGPPKNKIPDQSLPPNGTRPYYVAYEQLNPNIERVVNQYDLSGGMPYYLPKALDIVPHLLPDYHPYWRLFASAGLGPCNPTWQPCQSGLANTTLFMDPTANIINPPGTDDLMSNPANFNWLGWFNLPTSITLTVQFAALPLGTAPPDVTEFGDWCQNVHKLFPSDPNRTFDRFSSSFPTGQQQARRFTLEHKVLANDCPFYTGLNDPNLSNVQAILTWLQ
jgi:hypothetical protein